MKKKELTQAILHQLVLYHPTTGLFTKTDGSYTHQCINKGRVIISLGDYGQHLAYRLAFLFMKGTWPDNHVDHKDGNSINNAWCNLRPATNSENMQNQRHAKSNSKTGLLGVSKYNDTGKFYAKIKVDGVVAHLGVFDTAEEAHEVYIKVKRELHPFGDL